MRRLVLLFLLVPLNCGMNRPAEGIHINTTVASSDQCFRILHADVPRGIEIVPPQRLYPVCGTVSHHLLAASVINRWFQTLKQLRDVRTFIIISPNHARNGSQGISLSLDDWMTAGTRTRSNKPLIRTFMNDAGATEDGLAFNNEHGIGALLPFIAHYYPDADIVPILIDEKLVSMRKAYILADGIGESLENDAGIFFILSTDFSHRYGRAKTDENDRYSELSLLALDRGLKKISDSTAGLDILYRICWKRGVRKTHILCHTDSEQFITGKQTDITSYFFTYQY